jgi:hypothetical protein
LLWALHRQGAAAYGPVREVPSLADLERVFFLDSARRTAPLSPVVFVRDGHRGEFTTVEYAALPVKQSQLTCSRPNRDTDLMTEHDDAQARDGANKDEAEDGSRSLTR